MPLFKPKDLTFQVLDADGNEIGIVWYKDGFYMWEDKVNDPHMIDHKYDHPLHALAALYGKLTPT